MSWNPEIESENADEITFERERIDGVKTYTGEKAIEFLGGGETCNDFAWSYFQNNESVVVKVGYVNHDHHCYVYDAELDVTIDATLGQFDGCPSVGVWDGDTHPYVDDAADVVEWEDKDAFTAHYDENNTGPFYL